MTSHRIRIGKLGSHPTITFAVEELTRYLKKMDAGLEVDILLSDSYKEAFPRIIWVGMDPAFDVPKVENTCLDDAISIQVEQDNGYITGTNLRSVLIGVYRFLQELGCYWARPSAVGERIPQKHLENLSVTVKEAASYRHRGVCIEGATSYENILDMMDFLPKVGMNAFFFEHFEPLIFFRRWYNHKSNPYLDAESVSTEEILAMLSALEEEMAKRGILYHKTGHGWTCQPFGLDGTSWGAQGDKPLPEGIEKYFAQINGVRQLCGGIPLNTNMCYSQKEVRDRMTNAIVDYCKAHPNVDILHYWLSDGVNNHCECDECVKMLPSDWFVLMLNELDAALTEAKIDTKIVFLLYVDLLWAPEKLKLINQDRFILMFAPITRDYGQNYDQNLVYDGPMPEFKRNHLDFATSLAVNLAQLRQWQAQFTGDSFVYEYHLMYAHFNDPGYEYCARNTFEDMKGLRSIGINGNISCQLMRSFFPSALPMQMMALALWNRDADYEPNAQKYYLSAFGPDGLKVQKYLKTISDLFAIYEGPSHGNGAKITGDLVTDYEALEACLADFAPVIDANAEISAPWQNDWQQLKIHQEYVRNLAKVLSLTQKADYAGAKAEIANMLDHLNRNELFIQKVMDCNKAKMHWERRLDPAKCLSTDVM